MESNDLSLSEYFKLSEFLRTSVPNGIQSNIEYLNSDRPRIIENLLQLCKSLDKIRNFDSLPLYISSGLRSPMVNDKVGGVPASKHQFGLAADFVLHKAHHTKKFKLFLDSLLQSQIIQYYYFNYDKNFCHIQI